MLLHTFFFFHAGIFSGHTRAWGALAHTGSFLISEVISSLCHNSPVGLASLSSQQNHSRQLIDWTLTTYCWRLIIDYTGHLVSKENEKGGAVRLKAFSLDYKVKRNVYMVNTTLRVVFIFIFELLNYSYASCWLSRPYATECTETCLFSIAWAFFHTDRTLSLTTIVYSLSDLK